MKQLAEFPEITAGLAEREADMTASLLGSLSLRENGRMPFTQLVEEALTNYHELYPQAHPDHTRVYMGILKLSYGKQIQVQGERVASATVSFA